MPIEFPRLSGVCGFDTETRDPDLLTHGPGWAFPDAGEVVGFSVSWGERGEFKHYYPIAHAGGGNYPKEKCLAWLRSVMKDRSITWIMYNRMYDEGWLRRMQIPVKGTVYDVYTAIPLLDEYRHSYKLDDVAKDYLGVGKDEEGLMSYGKSKGFKTAKAVKGNLWRFPASVVAPYAEEDASVTLRLWHHVLPLLKDASASRNLWDVFMLETELLPVLLEMRWRGIRVDLDRAERAVKAYRKAEAKLAKDIASLVGVGVDIWSNESIQRAFDIRGITYNRTRTGKASFTAPWMKTLSDPLPRMILEQRKMDKTRTTFLEAYVLNKAVNGRIHPQVNPLPSEEGGAVTGRPSVTNPNMNNLPNVEKDPINGKLVRGCMLPEEGEQWAAIDYSQQEPRLMVHYAAGVRVPVLPGAQEAMQRYIDNPRMDFHNMMSEITGLIRKQAKNIFLGRCYGMGGGKYCLDVGLPVTSFVRGGKTVVIAGEEGQRQLDKFNDAVPWVEGLSGRCERLAKRHGYITTLLGRRCRFGNHGDWYYKALNRLIQGSAADQTKKAMLDAWKLGYVPLVTVYDELGFSVPSIDVARQLGDVMENAVSLRVPCRVDIEMGPSWGDSV